MNNLNTLQSTSKRTTLLTVLCILSFISGGFSILSNFFVVSLWEQIPQIVSMNPLSEQFHLNEMMETTFSNELRPMYITMLILNMVSIIGVSLIWKLKELGKHFYIAAQVCLLIAPMIWIKPFVFPFFDALITIIFIFLYLNEFKKIKNNQTSTDDFTEDSSQEE
ncbi:MAG: hypothetical protein PHR53_06730 [Bacteroidales bacterium]|nr:hypothetical protein [Bacteroidales bacterium]